MSDCNLQTNTYSFKLELAISLYRKFTEKLCVHHVPRSHVFAQLVYVRE